MPFCFGVKQQKLVILGRFDHLTGGYPRCCELAPIINAREDIDSDVGLVSAAFCSKHEACLLQLLQSCFNCFSLRNVFVLRHPERPRQRFVLRSKAVLENSCQGHGSCVAFLRCPVR